jgi:hypothetical protein
MLVTDMEAGMNALCQHSRAKTPRSSADNLAWENQLNPIWSAQVQVIANEFLKELTAAERTGP